MLFKQKLLIVGLCLFFAHATYATPVQYNYQTTGFFGSTNSALDSFLNSGGASGSFFYDNQGAFHSLVPAINPDGSPSAVAGASLYDAITNFTGSVGGETFSDASGQILIGDEKLAPPGAPQPPFPWDIVAISLDPSSQPANINGFSIDLGTSGVFTLVNVVFQWLEGAGGGDFLTNDDLVSTLPPPGFDGSIPSNLQLIFADEAGDILVSVANVTVTAVPEPVSIFLMLSGTLGLLLRRRN